MTYYVPFVKTTPKNREVHGEHFVETPTPIETKEDVIKLHETIAGMEKTFASRIVVLDWKLLKS